jgi:hypothetical protein
VAKRQGATLLPDEDGGMNWSLLKRVVNFGCEQLRCGVLPTTV